MSWIPAPLVPPENDHVPVTVLVRPDLAARLDALIDRMHQAAPDSTPNKICDAIFASGLVSLEAMGASGAVMAIGITTR